MWVMCGRADYNRNVQERDVHVLEVLAMKKMERERKCWYMCEKQLHHKTKQPQR